MIFPPPPEVKQEIVIELKKMAMWAASIPGYGGGWVVSKKYPECSAPIGPDGKIKVIRFKLAEGEFNLKVEG